MSNNPIPQARIEAARQNYLSGKSLAAVARETGISRRKLEAESATGGWAEDRKLRQTAASVPDLARAADERAEALEQGWRARIEPLTNALIHVAEVVLDRLQGEDLGVLEARELPGLARQLIEGARSLREMIGETRPQVVQPIVLNLGGPQPAAQPAEQGAR